MKFYLSGGMEYKKNLGKGWREWFTEQLVEIRHDAIDPVKMESPDEHGEPIQYNLTELKLQGKLDEVRAIVRRSLFRKDMWGIQLADALVVFYDESVQRGAGTLSESWEAFREGKPVYLVTEFPLDKVPTWLIGETTAVFSDFEDLLGYLKDHSSVLRDIMLAEKASNDVLGGIY